MTKVKPATRGAPPRAFPYRKGPLLFFPKGKKRITPPEGVRNFPTHSRYNHAKLELMLLAKMRLLMSVYCMFALFTAW